MTLAVTVPVSLHASELQIPNLGVARSNRAGVAIFLIGSRVWGLLPGTTDRRALANALGGREKRTDADALADARLNDSSDTCWPLHGSFIIRKAITSCVSAPRRAVASANFIHAVNMAGFRLAT